VKRGIVTIELIGDNVSLQETEAFAEMLKAVIKMAGQAPDGKKIEIGTVTLMEAE